MAKLINIRTVSSPSIGLLPLAEDPGTLTLSGYKREQKKRTSATAWWIHGVMARCSA